MGVVRLNHAVLYVRELAVTAAFYCDVLGFEVVDMTPDGFSGAVFLQAPGSSNDHDLGLFEVGTAAAESSAGRGAVGLYHLAWEVDTLEELGMVATALQTVGALTGSSDHGTTKSLYGRDPDGAEFEVVWLVPAALVDDDARQARRRIGRLDLAIEQRRYGSTTLGGVGVSSPG